MTPMVFMMGRSSGGLSLKINERPDRRQRAGLQRSEGLRLGLVDGGKLGGELEQGDHLWCKGVNNISRDTMMGEGRCLPFI